MPTGKKKCLSFNEMDPHHKELGRNVGSVSSGDAALDERLWASAGGEYPPKHSLFQERCLICFLSQILLAEGQ